MGDIIELGHQQDVGGRIWSHQIRRAESIGDRGLRKWIQAGKFPKPDGNLNGRNYWKPETYAAWKAEVDAGKYRLSRHPLLGTRRAS